jgi:intracellular septation protein A
MQWLSLALVIVLGGATMLTASPRFVMLKPSLAHFAVAAIMLRRGWMLRYLPDIARQNLPEGISVAAGYAWAGLLAGIGVANIVLALYADFATWAWFVSVGAIGLKLAAFLLQYAVFRALVRRNLRRTRAAASAGVIVAG